MMMENTALILDRYSAEEAISPIQTAIRVTLRYPRYIAGVAHKAIKVI